MQTRHTYRAGQFLDSGKEGADDAGDVLVVLASPLGAGQGEYTNEEAEEGKYQSG